MNKGVILVFLTAIISGVSIFLNSYGVQGLNPFAFTGMKNIFVALALCSIILFSSTIKNVRSLRTSQWLQLVCVGLIGGSIPFLLFFKGLSMGSGVTGAFIHKTMIVWVTLGALFFLKEKVNWKIIAVASLILCGNFLLLSQSNLLLSQGAIYIFIATLLWSGEVVLSKKLLKNIPSSIVAFGRMGFGAVFILVFLAVTGNASTIVTWNYQSWLWVLATSALLLGYVWTFYHGLKTVSVSTAVAILSFGSVITSVLQLLFLDKAFTVFQYFGHVCIIGAIILVVFQKYSYSTRSTA